tara:strand:- start:137 stop:865 length:729 start_codon:yes stop_codon:yes gene_type:complete
LKVLIIGAHGYLGPHVVKALEGHHEMLLTDIKPPKEKLSHPFEILDVSSIEQVQQASKGKDAIINLSVLRGHRRIAFDVNTRGCYNIMRVAAEEGIRRVINTGPHFTITGPLYEGFDHAITPDVPPHPSTILYALTKSLGQEICRIFSEHHDIYVLDYLFYNFRDPATAKKGSRGVPFIVSWADAGEAFRLGLDIDLDKLPSRCEAFFISGDMPQGKFLNEKAKRILGFKPKDNLEYLWHRT